MPSRKSATQNLDAEFVEKVNMNFDEAFDLLDQLTDAEVAELNDEFDPENNLLPIKERVSYVCTKQPSDQFKRNTLKDHLEKTAYESKVGEHWLPFIKPLGYVEPDRLVKLKPTPLPKARAPSPSLPELTDEEKALIENASEEELIIIAAQLKMHDLVTTQQISDVEHGRRPSIGTGILRPTLVQPQYSMSFDEEDEWEEVVDVDALLKVLRQGGQQDISIIVCNNQPYMEPEILEEIAATIAANKDIRHLSLANCNVTDSLIESFAEALETNTKLETLNLESNFISPVGMKCLLDAIGENSTLRELRVENQYSKIGPKCEIEMTDMVKTNFSLLNFGYSFETKGPRDAMSKYILRNNDLLREKRKRGETKYYLAHEKRLIEQFKPPWMIRRLKPKGTVELQGREYIVKGQAKKKKGRAGAMMNEMFNRAAQVSQRWEDKSQNGGIDEEYRRIEEQSRLAKEEALRKEQGIDDDEEDGDGRRRRDGRKRSGEDQLDDEEDPEKRRRRDKWGRDGGDDETDKKMEEDESEEEKRRKREKWERNLADLSLEEMTEEERMLWNSMSLRERRRLKGEAGRDIDEDEDENEAEAAKRRKREKWERDNEKGMEEDESEEEKRRKREKWERNLADLSVEEMTEEEKMKWDSMSLRERRRLKGGGGQYIDEDETEEKIEESESEAAKRRKREKWERDGDEPMRNLARLSVEEMTKEERMIWDSMSLRERRKLKEDSEREIEEEENEAERRRKREKWARERDELEATVNAEPPRNLAELSEDQMTEDEKKIWKAMSLRERRLLRGDSRQDIDDDDDDDDKPSGMPGSRKEGRRERRREKDPGMTPEEQARFKKREQMKKEEERRRKEEEAEEEKKKKEQGPATSIRDVDNMTEAEKLLWNSMSLRERRKMKGGGTPVIFDDEPTFELPPELEVPKSEVIPEETQEKRRTRSRRNQPEEEEQQPTRERRRARQQSEEDVPVAKKEQSKPEPKKVVETPAPAPKVVIDEPAEKPVEYLSLRERRKRREMGL